MWQRGTEVSDEEQMANAILRRLEDGFVRFDVSNKDEVPCVARADHIVH